MPKPPLFVFTALVRREILCALVASSIFFGLLGLQMGCIETALAKIPATTAPVFNREIRAERMAIAWRVEKERVFFRLRAPLKGWMAIGISKTGSLVGSHLIFARFHRGQAEVFDHQVVAFGDHRPDETLGGQQDSIALSGWQNQQGTEVQFSVRRGERDVGPPLVVNETFPLMVAYSSSNDLAHHSRYRSTVDVTFLPSSPR